MKNPDQVNQDVSQDIKTLNRFLLDSAKSRLILRVAVIAVAMLIWIFIVLGILRFGSNFSYNFLDVISAQLVEFFTKMNMYLWWGLVLILTVIAYFILSHWLRNHIRAAGNTHPSNQKLIPMLKQLSPQALAVLSWVWRDRFDPISIKDLYDTRDQLKQARYPRIKQAQQQAALLNASPAVAELASMLHNDPTFTQPTARTSPSAAGYHTDTTRPDSDPVIKP